MPKLKKNALSLGTGTKQLVNFGCSAFFQATNRQTVDSKGNNERIGGGGWG